MEGSERPVSEIGKSLRAESRVQFSLDVLVGIREGGVTRDQVM